MEGITDPIDMNLWKPSSQHAREKRGVAGLLLGRTERAARAAELQLCQVLWPGLQVEQDSELYSAVGGVRN